LTFSMARVAGVEERANYSEFAKTQSKSGPKPAQSVGSFGALLASRLGISVPDGGADATNEGAKPSGDNVRRGRSCTAFQRRPASRWAAAGVRELSSLRLTRGERQPDRVWLPVVARGDPLAHLQGLTARATWIGTRGGSRTVYGVR